MAGKKKLLVPDEQLTLLPMEPEPLRDKKPRGKRIASLEDRVTHLEADVALTRGQLEREEYLEEDDD